jgi:hypothetical protein
MSGCVNYSRRFYDEALRDPSTASPLVFPETVFNAPASHLAALLGTPALNYTLVGDPGTFLQGMALAADWLGAGYVDGCLVVGAEESDWMTSNGFHLFSRRIVISEGAGAIYLKPEGQAGALGELDCVTDSHSYGREQNRSLAARKISEELPAFSPGQVLIDGLQDAARLDAAETAAWSRWDGPRFSPKLVLGDGMMAGVAMRTGGGCGGRECISRGDGECGGLQSTGYWRPFRGSEWRQRLTRKGYQRACGSFSSPEGTADWAAPSPASFSGSRRTISFTSEYTTGGTRPTRSRRSFRGAAVVLPSM